MRNSITIAALAATCFFCSPVLASEVTPSSELEGDLLKSADVLGSYSLGGKLPVGAELTEHSSKTEISQGFGGYDDDDDGRGVYLGGSLGLFNPNLEDDIADEFIETGFGGSIFLGYQFNKNWSADVEVVLFGGDFDEDEILERLDPDLDDIGVDVDYSVFALFFNPRLTFPLGKNQNQKWSLFLSPGIGFGNASADIGAIEFEGDTSFAFQIKGGIGYKISRKIDIFVQARYLNVTETVEDIDDSGFSSFSPELGVKFDL